MEVDDFLSHHGVRGMHWGIRKQEVSSEPSVKSKSSKKKKKHPYIKYFKQHPEAGVSVAIVAGYGAFWITQRFLRSDTTQKLSDFIASKRKFGVTADGREFIRVRSWDKPVADTVVKPFVKDLSAVSRYT